MYMVIILNTQATNILLLTNWSRMWNPTPMEPRSQESDHWSHLAPWTRQEQHSWANKSIIQYFTTQSSKNPNTPSLGFSKNSLTEEESIIHRKGGEKSLESTVGREKERRKDWESWCHLLKLQDPIRLILERDRNRD